MATQQKIEPHKVTKPIQLLAAWLVGLILIDGAFLVGAVNITVPKWLPALLVIAAVLNVPLFLASIFLLQTRFRPEMQEDTYYSKYLESRTGHSRPEPTSEAVEILRKELAESNGVVTQLIAGVQESLQNLSKVADEGGGANQQELQFRLNTIQARLAELHGGVVEPDVKSKWIDKTVSVNGQLRIYPKILQLLTAHGIPIHETFGTPGDLPKNLAISIGSGFDLEHLRPLLKALAPLKSGIVEFAENEGPGAIYEDKVLIGSYFVDSGLPLTKAVQLLEDPDLNVTDFYDVLKLATT